MGEPMEVDSKRPAGQNIPWVEKYRPKSLNDVVGNPDTIKRFKYFAQNGNIPHMILAGPPGCGKTTTIHAMAREMLGHHYQEAVLELNASDDRGIEVVRTRIKQFAERHVTLPKTMHKIIVLDEVDSMTEGAQQALRRIMEKYSGTTRFMLACNLSDKVIEPIQSRCAIIKYSRLDRDELLKRVEAICGFENLTFTADGLEAIWQTSQGDLRQCTASGYGTVSADNVYKVCDEPDPKEIADFFQFCQIGSFADAIAYLETQRVAGYAFTDILTVLNRTLLNVDIPEVLKYEFVKILAKAHVNALKGHDSRLQLAALAAELSTVSSSLT